MDENALLAEIARLRAENIELRRQIARLEKALIKLLADRVREE